jgi:hypothetical protein
MHSVQPGVTVVRYGLRQPCRLAAQAGLGTMSSLNVLKLVARPSPKGLLSSSAPALIPDGKTSERGVLGPSMDLWGHNKEGHKVGLLVELPSLLALLCRSDYCEPSCDRAFSSKLEMELELWHDPDIFALTASS